MHNVLRELRTERGLSQGSLGAAVGVSRQTINAIETGRYQPSLPLAFGRVVVGALWVLEGSALVWTGARQGKPWMRWAGLALQATAAAVLFAQGVLDLDRAFTPSTLTAA